jgi:transcriptional regulator with XRE-family HTH domain
MNLASYLREIGMTYAQFADVTGFDVSQLNRWARGERQPSLDQAKRIRDATEGQVSYEDFVTDER